ncbi:hypothetical protein C7974DRAFT_33030 [Boeremia exigua]|uniref:uncharacterized protein n=1 Tax=Boeremia exigua TaxID=749465 RepID=UPI001E8CD436|nr:uncharacterized protein C7974DRAFT_33030 [Boeremia exigua]KAH6618591.1 hypothetical protein C7974DRAFT_33030 [Boeremia exigua]
MKAAVLGLSKLHLTTFKVSYSPAYTNFILNHIAINPSHPLYISQARRQGEHKKEGLWWHATNGTDISKSGCVRTWARRRLRRAFVEALKARGYDETGKLVDATAMQHRRDVMNVVRLGRSVDLTGSLRMHGVGPLIAAKFETVKEEMSSVIETILRSMVNTALGVPGGDRRRSGVDQPSARNGALPRPRNTQRGRPVAAPATRSAYKANPNSAVVEAAKSLFQAEVQAAPQPPPAIKATPAGPKNTGATYVPPPMEPRSEGRKPAFRIRRFVVDTS